MKELDEKANTHISIYSDRAPHLVDLEMTIYVWDCLDFDFSEFTTHTVSNVTCVLHLSFKLNKKRKRKNQCEPQNKTLVTENKRAMIIQVVSLQIQETVK